MDVAAIPRGLTVNGPVVDTEPIDGAIDFLTRFRVFIAGLGVEDRAFLAHLLAPAVSQAVGPPAGSEAEVEGFGAGTGWQPAPLPPNLIAALRTTPLDFDLDSAEWEDDIDLT